MQQFNVLDNSALLKLINQKIKKLIFRLFTIKSDFVAQLFFIKPFRNVIKQSRKHWQSTNNDPQLQLKSPLFIKGWYSVTMKVGFISNDIQTGKLYPDYGQGFDEKNAFILPHRHTNPTYKVIYLKKRPKRIRFDPVEDKIDFSIEELKFYPLTKKTAKAFMHDRIARVHLEYRKLSAEEIEAKLPNAHNQELMMRILAIYNETFSTTYSEINYQHWIKREASKQKRLLEIITDSTQPSNVVSILLPTYNSNPKFLEQCITSVLQQSYQKWQLCIVDDASTEHEHFDLIESFVAQDHRIDFHRKSENTHISDTTNACLKMAKGDHVLLLDHDDMLAPHTLLMMVGRLQFSPNLKLIYADEDKIDIHNARYEPHFKPEWNPDLLYSQNYIGHPVLLETERVRSIGGLRIGVEGSQDHDLLLRYTADLITKHIHRIPHVLYHWRAHNASTAANSKAKNYTTTAGIKALKDHFSTQNINAEVSQGKFPNTYKINWPIPKPLPLVTLIVPTSDGYDILKTCIKSILEKTTYRNYEILIIDNRTSCEKTLNFIKDSVNNNANVRTSKWDNPFNYSAINNYAVTQSKGSIVGLINNDIEVISPDWLTEMVSHAIRPDIGCVGAKLYYPNNKIQHAGVILGIGGIAGHSHKHFPRNSSGYFTRLHLTQNLSAVTAACLVVRKEIYNQVNGLDEKNLSVAFNDVDFCLKVRELGYRNLLTPWAELYHHESISRGLEDTPEKQKRAQKEANYMKHKWKNQLAHDPAYNPNLTLSCENFSLK